MSKTHHLHLQHFTTHHLQTITFDVVRDRAKVIRFEAVIEESSSGWSLWQVLSWIKPLGFYPPIRVCVWGFLHESLHQYSAERRWLRRGSLHQSSSGFSDIEGKISGSICCSWDQPGRGFEELRVIQQRGWNRRSINNNRRTWFTLNQGTRSGSNIQRLENSVVYLLVNPCINCYTQQVISIKAISILVLELRADVPRSEDDGGTASSNLCLLYFSAYLFLA